MGLKTAKLTVGCCLLLVLAALVSRADTWILANGDQLTGELVREDAAFIELQHPQLGRLKLPRSALRAPEAAIQKPVAQEQPRAGQPATKPVAAATDQPNWKRQVELGFVQQSGAKEKADLALRMQLDGNTGANTYRGTARVLQSEADGKKVTDREEVDFRWRHDVNKRMFAQALTTYSSDDLRKINHSLEQQIGGGYRLIDNPRHKINVGLGAVVQYLDRDDADEQTGLLGTFFQDYAYQWSGRIKLVQESSLMVADSGSLNLKNAQASAPVEGSYRLKFNTGMQSKVSEHMSLNVRFEYDYDRSIEDSALRADQRLTTSLGYMW